MPFAYRGQAYSIRPPYRIQTPTPRRTENRKEKIAMSEWFPVTKLLPTEEDRKLNDGQFLCHVIFPEKNGDYGSADMVIPYQLPKGWQIEDVIVTHWRYLPEDPEEVLL